MKLKYLIPFILIFGLILGACNGQYDNDLPNQTGDKDTNGEENQSNNEKEDTTKEKETEVTLEEAEAKILMSQYRIQFEEIVAKIGEDNLLEEYASIEEVTGYFNEVMDVELAEWYADTYFEVKNGDIYIIPKDGPTWLKEDQSFDLLKVDDHNYQLIQQRNNEWLGHVYYKVHIKLIDKKWKVAEIDVVEIDKASIEEAKFLVRDYLDFIWTEETILEVSEEDIDHFIIHVYDDVKSEEGMDHKFTRGSFYVNRDTSQISNTIERNAEVKGFASDNVKNLGMRVFYALKQKDMKEVASHVDKKQGLLFSPYLYIGSDSVVLNSNEVDQFFEDQNKYLWGHFDGRGNDIDMTPEEYFERFIYVEDFTEPEEVIYNEIVRRGNLKSNMNEIFGEIEFVEYYTSGSDDYEGMDWRGIYLVFDTSNKEKPVLVAIINNEWTI